ncbi:MAG: ribonuclease HIII [Verrucomicrobiae bacterium]|nr:ribonuclease HIII [Verrucomicrobiae bacterium]
MPEPHTYTIALTSAQIEKLKTLLQQREFEFSTLPYAHFKASKNKIQVAAYQSGKCVIQGKEAKDFIEFTLEPEILGEAKLGYEEHHNPEHFIPHIGVDESGKGDFFGPLVIAGVYADTATIKTFQELGIRDSKAITSDKKIIQLAEAIKQIQSVRFQIIPISPEKYNELQKKMGSVNEVLGWGHAKAIENLLEIIPCERAVCDQFARTSWTIKKYLGAKGKTIHVHQQHRAESDPVVAAASILARASFVQWLENKGRQLQTNLPLGASSRVKQIATELIEKLGEEPVKKLVKTHFKTWTEINQKTSS